MKIRIKEPYLSGKMIWMKKTLNIDENLLRQAREASGASTDTEAIRLGLKALVQNAAYARLAALAGTQPGSTKDVPRRREPDKGVKAKRRAA
jgi:Arc/MetJ family transcription regulator